MSGSIALRGALAAPACLACKGVRPGALLRR